MGSYAPSQREQKINMIYLKFFYMGDFFLPFTYLFNHFFILMCTRGYVFYILGYNSLLPYFVAQIVLLFTLWLLGALLIGSYAPLTMSFLCFFFF